MRLALLCIGRLKDGPERELFARYWDRLSAQGRPLGLGPLRLVEAPEGRDRSIAARQAEEAGRLDKSLASDSHVVLLDSRGKSLTSEKIAAHLASQRDAGCAEMAFVIGGPDGFSDEIVAKANLRLSLGAITLPHGLARVVLAEQLYRAATILAGHPYHRS